MITNNLKSYLAPPSALHPAPLVTEEAHSDEVHHWVHHTGRLHHTALSLRAIARTASHL